MLCTELALLPDYRGLQEYIDVIYECTGVCHLTLNPLKCVNTLSYCIKEMTTPSSTRRVALGQLYNGTG